MVHTSPLTRTSPSWISSLARPVAVMAASFRRSWSLGYSPRGNGNHFISITLSAAPAAPYKGSSPLRLRARSPPERCWCSAQGHGVRRGMRRASMRRLLKRSPGCFAAVQGAVLGLAGAGFWRTAAPGHFKHAAHRALKASMTTPTRSRPPAWSWCPPSGGWDYSGGWFYSPGEVLQAAALSGPGFKQQVALALDNSDFFAGILADFSTSFRAEPGANLKAPPPRPGPEASAQGQTEAVHGHHRRPGRLPQTGKLRRTGGSLVDTAKRSGWIMAFSGTLADVHGKLVVHLRCSDSRRRTARNSKRRRRSDGLSAANTIAIVRHFPGSSSPPNNSRAPEDDVASGLTWRSIRCGWALHVVSRTGLKVSPPPAGSSRPEWSGGYRPGVWC